jgi:hypothetical protein
MSHHHLENVSAASEAFHHALSLRKEGGPQEQHWIWQTRSHRHYCTWASLCLREGMLDEALVVYGHAASMAHRCPASLAGLAIVSMHRGELHYAQEWIDRVAFLDAPRGRYLRSLLAELRAGHSPELPSAPLCNH